MKQALEVITNVLFIFSLVACFGFVAGCTVIFYMMGYLR